MRGGSLTQHVAVLATAVEMASADATPWLTGGDFNAPPAATAARLGVAKVRATVVALPSSDGACWAANGSVTNLD